MQHAEFRRLFGANPKRNEPEVLAHRTSCAECARYAADLEKVDQMLLGAFEPGPARHPKPWEVDSPKVAARSPLRWYALAASLLVAACVATTMWFGARRDTLFVELLKHANAERNVMVVSDKRVSDDKIRDTLAKAGAHLQGSFPVSTLRTCKVRGVVAPHLFVQTQDGPVQLLLLTEHRFLTRHSSEAWGLRGELVPVGSHSVAVFAESEQAIARARELARQVDWNRDAS